MKEQFEDLKEKAPCGMLIHYTVDNATDMITYTDINGRGKVCSSCDGCTWRGICKPEKQKSQMSRKLYVEICNLIDDEIQNAGQKREEAADILAEENLDPRCVRAEKALNQLRSSTKRLREMESLLERFKEEMEECELKEGV